MQKLLVFSHKSDVEDKKKNQIINIIADSHCNFIDAIRKNVEKLVAQREIFNCYSAFNWAGLSGWWKLITNLINEKFYDFVGFGFFANERAPERFKIEIKLI